MATIVIATDGSQAARQAAELGLEIAQQTGDDVVLVAGWDATRTGFGAPWAYAAERVASNMDAVIWGPVGWRCAGSPHDVRPRRHDRPAARTEHGALGASAAHP